MKFKLRDIEPNPFRHMDRYPIREDKVAALRASIRETSFWDNLVARRGKGKKAQLAYGHHRLVALNEEYSSDHEIDLIVRPLTDEEMLKIMANENMEEWGSSPEVIQETVRAVVEAYAAGQINLSDPKAGSRGPDGIRYAPSFVPENFLPERKFPYTPMSLAMFLGEGWCTKRGSDTRPADRLYDALNELEAQELDLIPNEDRELLATPEAKEHVSRKDHSTIVNAGRKVYAREKKKTGDEEKAKEKARKVVSTLTGKAVQGNLTPDVAAVEVHEATAENKRRECPLPMIEDVAKRFERKLDRVLSVNDPDWNWIEELFKHFAYLDEDHRFGVLKKAKRVRDVLNTLISNAENSASNNGKKPTIVRVVEQELLEVCS